MLMPDMSKTVQNVRKTLQKQILAIAQSIHAHINNQEELKPLETLKH